MPNTAVLLQRKKTNEGNGAFLYRVNIDTINTPLTILTPGQSVTLGGQPVLTGSSTSEWKLTGATIQATGAGRVSFSSGFTKVFNVDLVDKAIIYFSASDGNADTMFNIASIAQGNTLVVESGCLITDAFLWVECA